MASKQKRAAAKAKRQAAKQKKAAQKAQASKPKQPTARDRAKAKAQNRKAYESAVRDVQQSAKVSKGVAVKMLREVKDITGSGVTTANRKASVANAGIRANEYRRGAVENARKSKEYSAREELFKQVMGNRYLDLAEAAASGFYTETKNTALQYLEGIVAEREADLAALKDEYNKTRDPGLADDIQAAAKELQMATEAFEKMRPTRNTKNTDMADKINAFFSRK